MNAKEIKKAVESGKQVYWKNTDYEVKKGKYDWFLKHKPSGNLVGLYYIGGLGHEILNEEEHEFFVKGLITKLPESIKSVDDAKVFLLALHENGESYDPDALSFDIDWISVRPSIEELNHLNTLMDQIWSLNEVPELFDPHGYLLDLINH